MQLLPKWVLPPSFPSVHDSESATVLEMTAKVYGAMNTLISEYNEFADTVNKQISGFSDEEKKAREEFQLEVTKVMRSFTSCMDEYLRINLNETAKTLINEALQTGKITVTEFYDPVTESLDIVAGGET